MGAKPHRLPAGLTQRLRFRNGASEQTTLMQVFATEEAQLHFESCACVFRMILKPGVGEVLHQVGSSAAVAVAGLKRLRDRRPKQHTSLMLLPVGEETPAQGMLGLGKERLPRRLPRPGPPGKGDWRRACAQGGWVTRRRSAATNLARSKHRTRWPPSRVASESGSPNVMLPLCAL